MTDRTVRVRYEAITAQYEAAMAKLGISTKNLGSHLDGINTKSKGTFKSLGMDLASLGTSGVIAGAGVAVAGVAILKMTKDGVASFMKLAGEVRAFQRVTGESAEESSKMIAVGNALGVSSETISAGMFRLSRQTVMHADALKADGVEIVKNKSGQTDLAATLVNVGDAYRRAGAGAAGNKIVFDAFGRSGLAMIPILKQNAAALEEFYADAAKHHEILSQDDLTKAYQMKLAVHDLSESWSGLERELGQKAVPALTWMAEKTTDFVDGLDIWAHRLGALIPGHHEASAAEKELAERVAATAQSMQDATDAAAGYKKSLDGTFASMFSTVDAQDKFSGALIDFADKVRAAQISGDAFALSLDNTTATGIANRGMLQGLVTDIKDTAEAASAAASAQGASAEEQAVAVAAATSSQRADLTLVLESLGFNKEKAQEYTDVLLNLDGLSVRSSVELDTAAADAALDALLVKLAGIPSGVASPALLDARDVAAGRGIPDSVASPNLLDERNRVNFWTHRPSGPGLNDALAGRGPQGTAAAAAGAKDAKSQVDDYLKSLKDAQDEAKRLQEATAAFLKSMYEHQNTIEDNQYAFGALSKDRYLDLLHERLKGLEEYSDAWAAVMNKIHQVEGDALDAELKVIAAYDQGRRFQQTFDALAGQREMSGARMVPAAAGSSTTIYGATWNPTFHAYGSDATSATATNSQKLRDYAASMG